MQPRTLIAIVALVMLGAGAAFVLVAPNKGQRSGPPPRPVAAFKMADVSELEITNEKDGQPATVKLVRSGAGADAAWKVGEHKADGAALKAIGDQLDKMTFGDVVTQSQDKLAEFNVADGKGTHLVARGAGGKVLADMQLGKSVGSFTMMRPAGKTEVWQVAGLSTAALQKDEKGFRDHTVLELNAGEAEKLSVETATGNQLTLTKDATSKKWTLGEHKGEAPADAAALDADMVPGVVTALAGLKANDFADDKRAEEVGLDKPVLTVTVSDKAGEHTLRVGVSKGDDTYVAADKNPQIFVLKKFALERVAKRPIDFRDKTVVKMKEADVQSIEIVTKDGTLAMERADAGWKLSKGEGDPNKLKGIAGAFENLVGAGLLEASEAGVANLKAPLATVTLHGKDKKTTVIKVGAESADKSEYYVARVGSPDVARVKSYLVQRFLKKPADVQKEKKT